MAVMPLVPETKMAEVGKLINLGNLLARKTTWLVLTNTFATSILCRILEPTAWQRWSINILIFQHSFSFHCDFQREHSHSLHFESTHSSSFFTFDCQHSTATKMYTLCNHSLPCYNFSVRLFPDSKTTTEISSNPERDKHPTWEKTRAF